MKSTSVQITPVNAMLKRIDRPGQVVMCVSGASLGYKIHWVDPGTSGSLATYNSTSEPLIDGEAYFAPNGAFREFWITCEARIMSPTQILELRVIDAAMPVVTLNPQRGGVKVQKIVEGAIGLLAHPNISNLYSEAQKDPLSETDQTSRVAVFPRQWIDGGVSSAVKFTAIMWASLSVTGATGYKVEYAKWVCDKLDADGRYSCSFANGGRTDYNTAGDNANVNGMLPWPARSLRFSIATIDADITDCYYFLAARTDL